MNIFEDAGGTNGHAAQDVIDLAPAQISPLAAKPEVAGVAPTPAAERAMRSIVAEMREMWIGGKMQGEALDQWVRIYSGLLMGATGPAEVLRAAELADVAYHVIQRRSQAK